MNHHPSHSKRLLTTILGAGFLVGLLDIIAACINFYINTGKNPEIVFQYIASSVFGRKAFSGENSMIVAGGLFHFLIAYAFTILFFFIYPRVRFLQINRILTAFVYGSFIWLVMNRLVLPLTKANAPAAGTKETIIGALILIVAIGLPLSFIAHRFFKPSHGGNNKS